MIDRNFALKIGLAAISLALGQPVVAQTMTQSDPRDPAVAVLVDRMTAHPRDMSIAEQREAIKGLRALSAATEPVERVDDHQIAGPSGTIPIRIYRPATDHALPVLLWFHGGSWVKGDLDLEDAMLRAVVNRSGWAIVAVGYRLAPEHPYPAASLDAEASLGWLRENADRWGLDADAIAVGGNSAGGAIAAALVQQTKQREIPLVGQILIGPMLDATLSGRSWVEFGTRNWVLNRAETECNIAQYLPHGTDRRDPGVSPLFATDLTGLPPTLILTAEADPVRDDGQRYADRLRGAGVKVTASRYRGMVHGFHLMSGRISQGRTAIEEVANWLRNLNEERK